MTVAMALATAVTFVWLGMVLAISFLEAPLKFRAPDVTLRIGLGIGRLVFRALNIVESMLAVMLVIAVVLGEPPTRIVVAAVVVVAILSVQLAAVRPRLTRRSDRVLSGEEAPRSHAHYAYIALEVAKVGALVVTGVLLLTG
ncbi:hypothetical protein P3H15_17235 [Rhodococcus sp. T2V]|uniref:hypothetical protein n=1 Tax=Rhodococcus sp. T2V TaxID=3034164 RepID=UPI0023E25866|nr:hypothetical protein [Rhodococcus sp. T2V]MDF3306770.1 hypothetical protein [Rhodococcus sp. T2V]